jgi:hypothetical protein
MFRLANWADRLSIVSLLAWAMLIVAALTGSMMVVVGMFEGLLGIMRGACSRSSRKRRS